VAKVCRTI